MPYSFSQAIKIPLFAESEFPHRITVHKSNFRSICVRMKDASYLIGGACIPSAKSPEMICGGGYIAYGYDWRAPLL